MSCVIFSHTAVNLRSDQEQEVTRSKTIRQNENSNMISEITYNVWHTVWQGSKANQ